MSKSTATATSETTDEAERQVAVDEVEPAEAEATEPTQAELDAAIEQAHADAGLTMTPSWIAGNKGSIDQDRGSKGTPLPGTIPEDETGKGGADTGPAGNDASATLDDDDAR